MNKTIRPLTFFPQTNQSFNELILPLESGKVARIPKMTKEDYNMIIKTLKLWRGGIILNKSIK